jgi:DNA-binding NarL/FixJ family response regulator
MHTLKTYIVEDNAVIRENLIAALEELAPVQVVGSAADESTALCWLSQTEHAVDLVIVDIYLAQGSGLGVLRHGQTLVHPRRMVVMSNFATRDMRSKCLALGADAVFDKSQEIEALMAYCNQLVAAAPGATGAGLRF